LDAPVRSQLIGNSIDMNCGLSVPPIGDVSSACLINHAQLVHTYNMCESQSAPPQMSSTTDFFTLWYLLPASLCPHNEAIHIMGSVICNLNCKLRICSSLQSYSTDIVHLRLVHLQQSYNLQYRHGSIPTSSSATVAKSPNPLVFAYLRSAAVVKATMQALLNSELRLCSSRSSVASIGFPIYSYTLNHKLCLTIVLHIAVSSVVRSRNMDPNMKPNMGTTW
jgi:hypothetical protein